MAYIYRNPHEQSLQAAQLEKANLERERKDLENRAAWIDQRLAQLDTYIQAIMPLIQEAPGGDIATDGLTKICREVLERNPHWMRATEVRLLLLKNGIDLSPYSNPMAVLHSVLKRVGQRFRASDGLLYYSAHGVPPMTNLGLPRQVTPQMLPPTLPPPARVTPQMLPPTPPPPSRITPEMLAQHLPKMTEQFSNNPLKGKKLK